MIKSIKNHFTSTNYIYIYIYIYIYYVSLHKLLFLLLLKKNIIIIYYKFIYISIQIRLNFNLIMNLIIIIINTLCVTLILCTFLVSVRFCEADTIRLSKQNLYGDSNEDVLPLEKSNFHANIFNQKRTVLAIFYVHWCSHCSRLYHMIKSFAQRIRHWKPLVQVVSVDCSTFTIKVCSELKIDEYPKIILLPPHASSMHEAQFVNSLIRSEDQFYKVVSKFLANSSTTLTGGLSPIYVIQKEEICNTFFSNTDDKVDLFAIVEISPSITSVEVFMLFNQW